MRRPGLSLIELLVILAIIGLLFALLLPALQDAREAARRISCGNRLHQIGVALHAYEASNGVFPPALFYWVGSGASRPGGPWNQNVALLPYLEMRQLYNALNLDLFWQDRANTTVTFVSPSLLLCPSDLSPDIAGYGFTNYQASMGSGLIRGGFDELIDPDADYEIDGFFGMSPMRERDVTDGLSHTAAFCEQIHGNGSLGARWIALPRPSLGLIYHFYANPPTQAQLVSQCEHLSSVPGLSAEPAGSPWIATLAYTHLFGPGKASCWGGNIGNTHSPITASSRHHGGVNLLLGDGHVRFVTNEIDLGVWRALGSRNGGEGIEEEF